MKDEKILYGTDCSVIGLKFSTNAGSPFLYNRIVTPTLQDLGVYCNCQQFAIMLCKIVRRIGHFLSVMMLIWSRGQRGEPPLAFLNFAGNFCYGGGGGVRSKGYLGEGSGRNQTGI